MSGYGRIELKRRYRWDMLLSFLVAAILVLVFFGLVDAITIDIEPNNSMLFNERVVKGPIIIPPSFIRVHLLDPCSGGPFIKTKDPGEFCDNGAFMPVIYGKINSLFQYDVDFGCLESWPRMLNCVRPRYPKRPQWEGKECDIRLKALVDRRGNVREVIILEPTEGNTEFEDAAVEAAYETVWKPAVANGQPIALWVTYRMELVLY